MISKRGEISVQTIIVVVILVLSFGVILYFLGALNFSQNADQQACHNSIILRGTARYGTLFEGGPNSIPLKCKTQKTCITDKKSPGGTTQCIPGIGAQSTEDNPVKDFSLDTTKGIAEQKMRYLDFLAEKIYSCHKLVGEGKVNFFPTEFTGQTYCLICDRFETDPALLEKFKNQPIKYSELYQTMAEKKADSGKSYLEEVYRAKNLQVMKEVTEAIMNHGGSSSVNWENWYIPINAPMAIVTAETVSGTWGKWVAVGTAVVITAGALIAALPSGGTSLTAIPAAASIAGIGTTTAAAGGTVIAGGVTFGAGSALTLGTIVTGGKIIALTSGVTYFYTSTQDPKLSYMPPITIIYDTKELGNLGCSSFETAP